MTVNRENEQELATVFKHWLAANSIKQRIDIAIPKAKLLLTDREAEESSLQFKELREHASMTLAICVWYALVYVTIEGYIKYGFRNETVDQLLSKKDYIDKLKLFRNATFHPQDDPLSTKITDFIQLEKSTEWVINIHEAFESFFYIQSSLMDIFLPLGTIAPSAAHR